MKEQRRPISAGNKHFPLVSWQKILEEQRRLKREQEEADTASRRHTGNVPTHHQFITNERFGDLLNITDNTEKRKSGVEVQYSRAVSYPCVSRKTAADAWSVCVWVRVWGVDRGVPTDTDGFPFWVKSSQGGEQWWKSKYELVNLSLNIQTTHCLPDTYLSRFFFF